jgi:hypothetical protein
VPEDEDPELQEEENAIQALLNSPDVVYDNVTDTITINGTRITIVDEEVIIPEMFMEYEDDLLNEIGKGNGTDGAGDDDINDNSLPGAVDIDAIKLTLEGDGADRKARGILFGEQQLKRLFQLYKEDRY